MFEKRGIVSSAMAISFSFSGFSQRSCNIEQHQQQQQQQKKPTSRERKGKGRKRNHKGNTKFPLTTHFIPSLNIRNGRKMEKFYVLSTFCHLPSHSSRSDGRVAAAAAFVVSRPFLVRHVNCAKRNINRKV